MKILVHSIFILIIMFVVLGGQTAQAQMRCDAGTVKIERDTGGMLILCVPFTPTPSPLPTATVVPTATPTPVPTATFILVPTPTPLPTSTVTPTPIPTATPTQIPTVAPTVKPTTVPELPPLAKRHDDAGIWGIYLGTNTPIDLDQPYIRGLMAYTSWRVLWTGTNTYNWGTLRSGLNYAINTVGKQAFVEVAAGYCPGHEWPTPLRNTIAQRKTLESQGCYPLQFYDPNYLTQYKQYIKALADELARFDSTDSRPNETNILYVRGAEMGETMENLPNTLTGWTYSNFNPAPNGRIYNVNLTDAAIWAYYQAVLSTYRTELNRAYGSVGLSPPEVAAKSASTHWRTTPIYPWLMEQNFWLDTHVSSPASRGLYYSFYPGTQSLQTRAATESAHIAKGAANWVAQWQYWELLGNLHLGAEFLGVYGRVTGHETLLPKGSLGFLPNRPIFEFADKYAGEMRNPPTSPGAWIALRGYYFSDNFGNLYMKQWVGNYEYGILQTNLPDSVALYGVDYAASAGLVAPIVERSGTPNWAAEFDLCRKKYTERECEPAKQFPDLLISAGNYTFKPTDLGVVQWCGTTMFCESGTVTRSEPMLWARSTKNAIPLSFSVNPSFAASQTAPVTLRVTYLDKGIGKWALVVDGVHVLTVSKTNRGIWRQAEVTVSPGALKLQLDPLSDGEDIFHMLEIVR